MILFLDFDGVLHPEQLGHEFCSAPILWEVLRQCAHVNVVISSSWREIYSLGELAEFVTRGGGEDLADRIIGATPNPEIARTMFARYKLRPKSDGYRLRECEIHLWRHMNGVLDQPWLAIDDVEHGFTKGTPNLYPVDPKVGLCPVDVAPLVFRLASAGYGQQYQQRRRGKYS